MISTLIAVVGCIFICLAIVLTARDVNQEAKDDHLAWMRYRQMRLERELDLEDPSDVLIQDFLK